MIELIEKHDAVLFRVRVSPGASKTRVLGEHNGALKIAVTAAPEKGKANKAVVDFLAAALSVRKADVSVVSGLASRDKQIAVSNLAAATLSAKLSALCRMDPGG